jgi:hypothetical protein
MGEMKIRSSLAMNFTRRELLFSTVHKPESGPAYGAELRLFPLGALGAAGVDDHMALRRGRAVLEITESGPSGWLTDAYDRALRMHDVKAEWLELSAQRKLYVAGDVPFFVGSLKDFDIGPIAEVAEAFHTHYGRIIDIGGTMDLAADAPKKPETDEPPHIPIAPPPDYFSRRLPGLAP